MQNLSGSVLQSTSKLIKLKAFPLMHEQHSRSYRVWTKAELSSSELRIRFKLEAAGVNEFAKIIIPPQAPSPKRMSDLWKETCFECFIPSSNSDAYLEFNGSPSGNWNWYSFTGYRYGMKEFQIANEAQPRQTSLTMSDQMIESEWVLPAVGLRIGFLSAGLAKPDVQQVGLSTVLNTTIATTYWSLDHQGVKPDFHDPSSFTYSV